jgi:WD40 repeat protein
MMQVLSSSADGLVKLWSLRTGECVNTFDEHTGKIWAMSSGGKAESLLATGRGLFVFSCACVPGHGYVCVSVCICVGTSLLDCVVVCISGRRGTKGFQGVYKERCFLGLGLLLSCTSGYGTGNRLTVYSKCFKPLAQSR